MNWRDEVKIELKKKGFTQRLFCKRTGIHQPEFNNMIHGKRRLSMKHALSLELYMINTAEYWLNKQLKEDIEIEKRKDNRF